MALNSVNTNMGAMVALQSLEVTQSALTSAQKRIATGQRVADSTDDGAAYAIAQTIRSTVGALTSANQQLGNVQGLLSTTQKGLNNISNMMSSMRDVLVKLSDSNVAGAQRTDYVNQYNSMLANVRTFVEDAAYSGKTLIGDINLQTKNETGTSAAATSSSGSFSRVAVARNESGSSYGIATFSGNALYGSINFGTVSGATFAGGGATTAAAAVAKLITAGGVFLREQNQVGNALNTVGSEINYVNNQTTYNSDKIDALNGGLGSLVDADLAKESAQLTALQIRQQLGTQALSLANQAPQTLLSLFK